MLLLIPLLNLLSFASAFTIPTTHTVKRRSSALSAKATLSPETTWRLRFSLNGVPTKNGRKVGELFNVDVQFVEEEGYGKFFTLLK